MRAIAILMVVLLLGCASAGPYILITSDHAFPDKLGYLYPEKGKKFVIAYMTIENCGYDNFEVSPYRFKLLTLNKVEYTPSIAACMALPNAKYELDLGPTLDSVNLKDGGSVSGSIAYEIPEDDWPNVASPTYSLNPWENIKIRWVPGSYFMDQMTIKK